MDNGYCKKIYTPACVEVCLSPGDSIALSPENDSNQGEWDKQNRAWNLLMEGVKQ